MSTTVNEFQPATSTGRIANFVDTRTGMSPIVKFFARKIFPDHWTFMFGEVALYSFVILLLSGAFLTLFFDPSMSEVVYDGAYAPLRGIEMSAAYASTLDISFDVRGGLFMREYLPRARAFPEVPALFRRIRAAGQKIVLASSGSAAEVDRYKEIAGIAGLTDAETTKDDAERSKPSPDIFRAALERIAPIGPG